MLGMKARSLVVVLVGLMIALSVYQGGLTAREQARGRVDKSRSIERFKRTIHRLRQRLRAHEPRETDGSVSSAIECWAKSESEAREKLLAFVMWQEKQWQSEVAETPPSEIDQYPERMSSVLCEDGVSEREKLAIAAELSSRYTWKLELMRRRSPKNSEHSMEVEHQIVKKHLGAKRYLDQVLKCHAVRQATDVSHWTLGVEQFSRILGVSEPQESEVKDLLTRLNALEGGIAFSPRSPVSVLDDAGRMVDVVYQTSGETDIHGEVASESDPERERQRMELSEKFFSLLTPEQAQRYQKFLEDQGSALGTLAMIRFETPEKLRELAREAASATPTADAGG